MKEKNSDSTFERLHDLKSVYTDVKIIIELIEGGYSFNDADAPALIEQLQKSLLILNREIKQLEKLIPPHHS